jgi:hypothetical protein
VQDWRHLRNSREPLPARAKKRYQIKNKQYVGTNIVRDTTYEN